MCEIKGRGNVKINLYSEKVNSLNKSLHAFIRYHMPLNFKGSRPEIGERQLKKTK